MKKSKLNENQIVSMLNEGEAGIPVAELCRKYQISNATFYMSKSNKFPEVGPEKFP